MHRHRFAMHSGLLGGLAFWLVRSKASNTLPKTKVTPTLSARCYPRRGYSEDLTVTMKPSLCTHIASCQHRPEKFSKLAMNKFSVLSTRLARDHVQQRAQRCTLETGPTTAWIAAIPAMVLKLCLETDSNILKIAACRETNIRYLWDPMPNSPEVSKKSFCSWAFSHFKQPTAGWNPRFVGCWFVKSHLHSSPFASQSATRLHMQHLPCLVESCGGICVGMDPAYRNWYIRKKRLLIWWETSSLCPRSWGAECATDKAVSVRIPWMWKDVKHLKIDHLNTTID